jgi:hypothetical protein
MRLFNHTRSKNLLFGYTLIVVLLFTSCEELFGRRIEDAVFGYVVNESGPVNGAVVRIQATETYAITNENGYFAFLDLESDDHVVVTAWTEGHYIGWAETVPSSQPISISLSPYSTADNFNYDWSPNEGGLGSIGCAECHPAYDEWQNDAHSQSAVNPRFLTMYSGTDADGNQSPLTRFGYSRDYGSFPLLPDPAKPYYGPGYKIDFPDTDGNCGACHVPAQAAYPGEAYSANPTEATGVEQEGIFCDFCHKIGGVTLNPNTGMPNPNMPGILSIDLLRPEEDGEDLFLGNFDDVVGPDSYLPLYEESAYCAPCHFATFWDTTVYNSFGEWLDSSYSDAEEGQTCQNCHMPAVEYAYFVYPQKGGVKRDPETIFNHDMTGFMEEELMQNAVDLSTSARFNDGLVELTIEVENDQTGHAVPTDYPLRQMILVIDAVDENGNPLALVKGEIIPFYGGEGNPNEGYFAGVPGKIYMKVLQEIWTETYPSGAYWNPTRILSDNRLLPFETDRSEFVFESGDATTFEIHVRLLFRRATKELMDLKGWDVPDILMEEASVIVRK